jgi:hypothetical protein
MAHETSSASDDALAWTTAIGRTPLGDEDVVLSRVNSAFVRSYVVKNAPATICQIKFSSFQAQEPRGEANRRSLYMKVVLL